jgi:hypothetical protein
MNKVIWWFNLIGASVNILLIPIGGAFNFACAVLVFLVCLITANHVFRPVDYVFCTRCPAKFPKSQSGMTAGYYDCNPDSYWSQFVNPGETVLCDECMWKTDGYRKLYGIIS